MHGILTNLIIFFGACLTSFFLFRISNNNLLAHHALTMKYRRIKVTTETLFATNSQDTNTLVLFLQRHGKQWRETVPFLFFSIYLCLHSAVSFFRFLSFILLVFPFFPHRSPGGRRSRAAHAVKTDKNGIVRAVKQLLSRYLYVGPRLRESVSAIRPSFFRRRHVVRERGEINFYESSFLPNHSVICSKAIEFAIGMPIHCNS